MNKLILGGLKVNGDKEEMNELSKLRKKNMRKKKM